MTFDPSNYRQAHQRIKTLWRDGLVEILGHAQARMAKRNYDRNDIQNVVRYGRIVEHTKPMTLWRYTLMGTAVDGARMKCVVEIDGSLLIVTVI